MAAREGGSRGGNGRRPLGKQRETMTEDDRQTFKAPGRTEKERDSGKKGMKDRGRADRINKS